MTTGKRRASRLLSLILALAMCLSVLPVTAAAEDETTTTTSTYTKVTSVDDLSTGDTVIIVASASDVAMSTNQKSNNRGEIAITKSSDGSTVTATSTDSDEYVVQELEVQTGNVDGTYALYTGSGYLYAVSSSSNYLKTESTLSDNSSWTISIDENGVATLLAQGTNTRNWMRYNSGSSLFACYASTSSQQDISLYKLTDTTESGGSTTDPTVTVETPSLSYSQEEKTVTFKCVTSGVTYYYSYSESGTYTALEGSSLDVSDHIGETLYAYAELDGSKSETTSVELTAASTEPTVSGYDLITGDITSGDQVMIYYPAGGTAITGTASGSKLTGGAVTVTDSVMETNNVGEVFTVYVDDNGYLSFVTDEGAYLTCGATGNSLSLASDSSDYSLWTLESAGESGSYYIKSVNASYEGSAQYIEYYNSGFTTYGFSSSKASLYTYQFYYVGHTDAEQPSTGGGDEEQSGTLSDGTYVIWAPSYNMALTSTPYATYYLAGEEVSLTDNTLSGYTSAAVWTVTVTTGEDGTQSVTLAQGDSYLGVVVSGSYYNLTFGATENTSWTLEDASSASEGCYYLKNTGTGRYLEWYASKSDWSLYSSVSSGSEGMFALKFTPVEATGDSGDEDDSTLTSGTYVIWNPAYGKALSSTMTGSYYAGVAVTESASGKMSGYGDTELWTVTVSEDGTLTLEQNGSYMGMNNSNYLTFGTTDALDHYTWTVEDAGDGLYYLKDTTSGKYVEWYSDYSDWSTYYSISSGKENLFALKFSPVSEDDYTADTSIVEAIASWGGGGAYEDDATAISGDLYNVNDQLDGNATFTAVISGTEKPHS